VSESWTLTAILILTGLGMIYLLAIHRRGRSKLFRIQAAERGRTWRELAAEHLPLGAMLVDEDEKILWTNRYLSQLVGKNIKPGLALSQVFPGSSLKDIKGKEQSEVYHWSKRVLYFKAALLPGEGRNLYIITCEDVTGGALALKRGQDFQPVIAFIQADNLEEVLKNMEEEDKPHLQGALERVLTDWANNLEGYLRQTGEGKYLLFLNQWGFRQAEKGRFAILDRVREIEAGNAMPLTISIGIGIHEDSISEMGRLAGAALELALDRGGDQVVVKTPELVKFYGGKSSAGEKRTKVKARVTAYALKDLIQQAENVIIMGHDLADYDSLGASLGLARAVQELGKKAYVVLDQYNPGADRLLEALPGPISAGLVKAREALRKAGEQTLLIVVDTHKPSLVASPPLLEKVGNIVVIDHHRRGEEFIAGARLVYLETYASSTSELVTELLQYLGNEVEIGKAEATALLAGIAVDTKNFMFQTGTRTFEAASYLRSLGAEPVIVQRLLRDDLATVVKKAEGLSRARVLYGQIALGVCEEESEDAQLLAAKTADAMLNIAGVNASFVLWAYQGGVAVSARSNGEINVQIIMERLGGGGHLTVAAAQVNKPLAQVEEELGELIKEMFSEEV